MSESPKKRWSRRRVVAISAAGLAFVAMGWAGYGLWRFSDLKSEARGLALALAKRMDDFDLKASDELISRWVRDYEAFGGSPKMKTARPSRKQVESLLMSTDLFSPDRDAQANPPLNYVGHYNPHKNICFNPLRRA